MNYPLRPLIVFLLLLTAPLALAEQGISRIAIGSCADQRKPQPVWAGVARYDPEMLLLLGDNVYADTTSMAEMQSAYDQFGAIEGYSELASRVHVEAIWDDHDFGANDAGREYPKKQDAAQIFLEFFREPRDSVRWQREGIYAVREIGPADQRVQLILLDTRTFRSPWKKSGVFGRRYEPDPDPDLTMLGEAQWAWLEQVLEAPAKLRLVATGIQVINDEHGYETWGNFPHERERLFRLLAEKQAGGVILLSGDRHFAEISEIDAGLGYPLIELTASGLTHSWPAGPESPNHRRLAAYGGINFGSLTIDWTALDPMVRIAIHDVTGRPVSTIERRLSSLSAAQKLVK